MQGTFLEEESSKDRKMKPLKFFEYEERQRKERDKERLKKKRNQERNRKRSYDES